MVTIKVNGEEKQYPKGIALEEIANGFQEKYDSQILIAIQNGKIKELSKNIKKDGEEITFLTMKDKIGHATYVRSVTMLLVKAVADVVGDIAKSKIKVDFSLGHGYYCSVKGDFVVNDEFIENVKRRMHQLVDADLPITKQPLKLDYARELFANQGMEDKEELFWYRRSSYVNVYCLDGYFWSFCSCCFEL